MAAPDARPVYFGPLLGVVFDLDGTLVDSAHDFLRMRREVIRIAEAHGVAAGRLSLKDPIPRIVEAALSELGLAGVPEGGRYRFESEVNDVIDSIELEALPRTRVRDGAVTLLRTLAAGGYRLGVLTRSSEVFCRAALKRTGLEGYFPNLRTRSSPGPAKPSPEALLLLLKEMAVPLDRADFVGDHPFDGECASRARVRFLGVLPMAGAEGDLADRLKRAGAISVARDLQEVGRLLGVPPAQASAPRA